MKWMNILIAIAIVGAGAAAAAYLATSGRAQSAADTVNQDHEDAHSHDDAHPHEEEAEHDSEAPHDAPVTINDEAAREGGIETAVAGPVTMRGVSTLPGEIALNANTLVHIVPRLSGVVREVRKNLGDTVAQGDLLAIVDSRALADAKSDYLAALERRDLAQTRFSREKQLFEKKISSEDDFLATKQALAELDIAVRTSGQKLQALGLDNGQLAALRNGKDTSLTDYPIHAPIAGTVIEKHMSIGEAVEDNADAFVIADLSSVWAEIVVYAADLKRIRQGQKVTVHSEDLDYSAEGAISYIGALVGQQTRTATATVELPNQEGIWKPGLFVTTTLASEPVDVAVAVTATALQTLDGAQVVFVKNGATYEPRKVTTGRSGDGMLEITEGLSAGETYVSKNSYLVKADIEKAGASHEH